MSATPPPAKKDETEEKEKKGEEHLLTLGHHHVSCDAEHGKFSEDDDRFYVEVHGLALEDIHTNMEIIESADKMSYTLCVKQRIKLTRKKGADGKALTKKAKVAIERKKIKNHPI